MDEYWRQVSYLEEHIKKLKSRKKRNGTKIYYAEVQLARLKRTGRPERSLMRPSTKPTTMPHRPQAKPCPENRAFVLHREIYDLTQAMVALEKLRTVSPSW